MGKQIPERKGNSLKTFHLTIFWAEIQDTKFGLWIRDVALHLLKKEKNQTLRQKPGVQSLQNSNDSDTGWDDTKAQQGRGEHVSGEEELPSVIC